MTLSEQMIHYRAKENINQQELADRCNLSKQVIHLIECGKKEPSKITRAKIEIVISGEKE